MIRCRTCGGDFGTHYMSYLDPDGIGHPDHWVEPSKRAENPAPHKASNERELAQILRDVIIELSRAQLISQPAWEDDLRWLNEFIDLEEDTKQ